MKQRCCNPNAINYYLYGARGISICHEWINDSEAFILWALNNGWSKNLDIDRIDNEGNYCPQNCRFVSRSENNKNRRTYNKLNSKYIYKHGNRYRVQKIINGKTKIFASCKSLKEAEEIVLGLI